MKAVGGGVLRVCDDVVLQLSSCLLFRLFVLQVRVAVYFLRLYDMELVLQHVRAEMRGK